MEQINEDAVHAAALRQEAAELSAAVFVERPFGDIINHLRRTPGARAARFGWLDSKRWIVIIRAGNAMHTSVAGSFNMRDCIGVKTADGDMQPGWCPSQADMLADDWVLLDPA